MIYLHIHFSPICHEGWRGFDLAGPRGGSSLHRKYITQLDRWKLRWLFEGEDALSLPLAWKWTVKDGPFWNVQLVPGSFSSPVEPRGPIISTSDTERDISRCTYQLGYRLKLDYREGEERRDRKMKSTSTATGPPEDGGRGSGSSFQSTARSESVFGCVIIIYGSIKGNLGLSVWIIQLWDEEKMRGLAFSESAAVGKLFVFFVVQCWLDFRLQAAFYDGNIPRLNVIKDDERDGGR